MIPGDFGDVMISLFPLLVKIIGVLMGALILIRLTSWAAGVIIARQQRGDPRVAAIRAEREKCHRCRTGSTAFPCGCGTDCYEAVCHGWVDDVRRDAIRGDR